MADVSGPPKTKGMAATLSTQSLVSAWEQFLTDYYKLRIEEAALNYPETRSVEIDYNDLDRRDPNLAQYLLDHPRASIQSSEEALRLIEVPVEPRPALRVRVKNIPRQNRYMVRKLRAEHLGKFVAVEGLIKKVVEVRPKLKDATFQCQRCGAVFNVQQEDQVLNEPKSCDEGQGGCGRDGPFKLLTEESKFIDSQKVEIQESHEDLRGGAQPERITVYLEEDLTGKLYPGDSIVINGVFRAQQRRQGSLKLAEFIKVIDCVSFEVQQMEFEEIEIKAEDIPEIEKISKSADVYKTIRESFAPEIYGMEKIKDSLILSLFGGVAKEFKDGTRIRGDIHCLLVGDPGVAKSQLLRYLSKLSPRSIYTSGKGTSAAGLTATAVRDEFGEGQWSLEAGALVLADKGVACLHPDSEVLIGGRPRRVADLFDSAYAVNAKTTNGGVLELAPLLEPTVNLDLGRLETRTPLATLVTRRRLDGKMMRVRLSSGFELKVTPDHLVLSGKDLSWRPMADFRVGDPLVAVQRLPSRRVPTYILDIVPDDWIVTLSGDERAELRGLVEERFDSLAEANRFFGLSREAFNGRDAFTVAQFRHVLRHVGVYETWRARPLPFGRAKAGERLRVSMVTPDLAYVLGFIYGDGHVSVDAKHPHVGVTQSTANQAQVDAFMAASGRIFSEPWHDDVCVAPADAAIRGSPVNRLRRESNLLAFLADWIISDGLANLLRLDDLAVRAFVAGALDADGCVSVRTSRKGSATYENVAIEFALSADRQENLRFLLALRRLDVFARLRPAAGVYHVEITNRADAERLLAAVRPYSVKFRTLPPRKDQVGPRHERIPSSRTSALLSSIDVSPTALLADGTWSTFHDLREGRRMPTKPGLHRVMEATSHLLSGAQREEAAALLRCDYALDHIESIVDESYSGYVYDLRVPDGEQFVCDGVVVHNCIDELDKMDENDQSAMHQAMEQQEISVSKAGISATLKSRCAVIGAANPKTGRFDDFAPIVQQINMPPPLLSRFDLIFGLRDRPNKEQDERIARHILGTHRAGEVHMARKRQPDGSFTEAQEKSLMTRIEPVVPEKTLRKYVAYAKRNFYPVLTDEAANSINAFYQTLRNQASGTIGITPRQIEAIIRLAEASAKIRLSTEATQEDANRAISIFTEFLKTIGWNDEAGTIDIDIIAAGASSSQQERMRKVLELIRRLNSESAGEGAKLADVLEQAQQAAPPIPADKVEEAIRILKERGSIFQPRGDRYAPL